MNTKTKTKRAKADFRVKYTDYVGNARFITRKNGRLAHFSGNLTPHALSNVAGENAADLQFALEDSLSAADAAAAIRKFGKYAKTVEVI